MKKLIIFLALSIFTFFTIFAQGSIQYFGKYEASLFGCIRLKGKIYDKIDKSHDIRDVSVKIYCKDNKILQFDFYKNEKLLGMEKAKVDLENNDFALRGQTVFTSVIPILIWRFDNKKAKIHFEKDNVSVNYFNSGVIMFVCFPFGGTSNGNGGENKVFTRKDLEK